MGSIGLETDAINVAFHLFAGWSVESSFVRRPGHFTPNCLIRVVLLCAYHMNIAYIYMYIGHISHSRILGVVETQWLDKGD